MSSRLALRAFDDPGLRRVADVLAHTGVSAKRLIAASFAIIGEMVEP
jgi:hypothetical protein